MRIFSLIAASPWTGALAGVLSWVMLVGIEAASPAWAQDTPVELKETGRFGMGARALGMGNAYGAVSEDIAALRYNPAGLAQIRKIELASGIAHDDTEFTTEHFATETRGHTNTRFEHVAVAYPVPTYRGSLVVGFGFYRWADLDQESLKAGYPILPTPQLRGLYEEDSYRRSGAINALTAAVGYDIAPRISVGASVTYLTGTSREDILNGTYRATLSGPDTLLDLGSIPDFDDRLFEEILEREADLTGYTASLGVLANPSPAIRVGLVVDLPTRLNYDGTETFRLEDSEKFDSPFSIRFEDEITLPLSISGDVSWGRSGVLLAGGFRWTDYTQIDFAGKILAPGGRESAYRSVIAAHLGTEVHVSGSPVRVRAGAFTEPLPYRLIAADADFVFVPDDSDPNTFDDISIVFRDYSPADIITDRKFVTVGAGVLLERSITVDAAFVHGWWKRATSGDYENTTDHYPTLPTTEKVTQNRLFASITIHFE